MPNVPGDSRIIFVALNASDLDRSVAFYRDAFSHAHALSAGAEVVHDPRDEPWGATSRYRDPDGNLVSITQSQAG